MRDDSAMIPATSRAVNNPSVSHSHNDTLIKSFSCGLTVDTEELLGRAEGLKALQRTRVSARILAAHRGNTQLIAGMMRIQTLLVLPPDEGAFAGGRRAAGLTGQCDVLTVGVDSHLKI